MTLPYILLLVAALVIGVCLGIIYEWTDNEVTKADINDIREELSALALYLGAGMGDEHTPITELTKRIKWGVDYHSDVTFKLLEGLRSRVRELEVELMEKTE
jgi:hypothetical protein